MSSSKAVGGDKRPRGPQVFSIKYREHMENA